MSHDPEKGPAVREIKVPRGGLLGSLKRGTQSKAKRTKEKSMMNTRTLRDSGTASIDEEKS